MKLSGIYRIKNIITDDCYVGSSKNIEKRWYEHQRLLKNNKHGNPKLQSSYNKYGCDAFKYEIFEICPVEYLLEREQERIDSGAFSYNLCLIAACPPSQVGNTHNKGRKFSAEHRAKLSAANKGNTNGKGHKHSEESKAKMSAANKGNKRSLGKKRGPYRKKIKND